jgi:hypothetical protein
MTSNAASHVWRFFRAGGSDQVALERGADLIHLEHLDPKLWVALAMPVKGLELDERTLHLMDSDDDGRLRVPEVIGAVKWALGVVKDPESLLKGGDLPLSTIDESRDEGRSIGASAREILANLGRAGSATISVAETMATAQVFAQTQFNGDGVVPVESVGDPALRDVATLVVERFGATTDRSGKPGFTQEAIDRFFSACEAYDTWYREGEADAKGLLPLGDGTGAAFAALTAVRVKVNDWFGRARLAAFDPRSLAAVNRREEEYLAIAAGDLKITAQEVAGFPLARVEAGARLPLTQGINPAWAAPIGLFRALVVAPIVGGSAESLSEADWARVQNALAKHEEWQTRKAGSDVEDLGIAKVRALRSGSARKALSDLVAQDKAHEPEMNAIASVERLARYHRDLLRILNNFVAFRDFYSRERPAAFQAGTLYLDGRSCTLCIRVDDAGKHAALAGLAKSYLAYCDCSRGGERMTIVAAFTDGDSDNLMIGRNGVFYDRKGRDWDATITKVIENPISVREAFWGPYKKLVRMIEEQVAKRAAAGEAAADARLSATASTTANVDKSKPPEPKKIDVGTVAALGVAFGALATAFAAIAGYLAGVLTLPFWQVCLAFVGMLLLISTPSMAIAWLKLRQRNMGPILDANGWAVNGRVKMNVPFGGTLTQVAHLPPGAASSLAVKYPETPTALPKLIMTLLGIAFAMSLLNHYGVIRSLSGGRIGSRPASERVIAPVKPAGVEP